MPANSSEPHAPPPAHSEPESRLAARSEPESRLAPHVEPEATRAQRPAPRRAICDQCGARGSIEPGESRTCSECGGAYRPMALLEGLVDRWLAPAPQHISEFYPRHLKLIELMWTAEGRGSATYAALALERVSYTQFVARATPIVVRGLAEGWIEIDIPPAPTTDDTQYHVRFVNPERWADELTAEFIPPPH